MSCSISAEPKNMAPLVQLGAKIKKSFEGLNVGAVRCSSCGHIRFPSPSREVLENYYKNVYGKLSNGWYSAESDFAIWKRGPRADRILKIASGFGRGAGSSFHEVGCAFGGTVYELQQRGFHATGTDLNADAIAEGREKGAVDTRALDDVEFLRGRDVAPDVIYGFHVLEHMPDPIGYLRSIAEFVADGGIIIMMVPNAMASHPLIHGYQNYDWFSFPGHLHYFSAKSCLCLARAAGLDIVHISSRNIPGVMPPETPRAIVPLAGNPTASILADRALEAAFLGEELVMVLTSPSTAEKFADARAHAHAICEENGLFEAQLRALGERVTP